MKKLLSLFIAVAMMAQPFSVTMAAEKTATDKTVVFVQEDWNYDLTGLADKKLLTYQNTYGSVDGGFGWWCESNDVSAFKNAVDAAISADYEEMKKKEFDYLRENYSVDKAYNTVINHYN